MSNKLEQLEFKLKKLLGFRNMQKKLENVISGQGFCPKDTASYLNHLNSHPIFSPTLCPIKKNSVFVLILNRLRFSLFGQTTG